MGTVCREPFDLAQGMLRRGSDLAEAPSDAVDTATDRYGANDRESAAARTLPFTLGHRAYTSLCTEGRLCHMPGTE